MLHKRGCFSGICCPLENKSKHGGAVRGILNITSSTQQSVAQKTVRLMIFNLYTIMKKIMSHFLSLIALSSGRLSNRRSAHVGI